MRRKIVGVIIEYPSFQHVLAGSSNNCVISNPGTVKIISYTYFRESKAPLTEFHISITESPNVGLGLSI